MFCGNCGHEIPDDTQFCPDCGANQETKAEATPAATATTESAATTAAPAEKKKLPVKLIVGVVAVAAVLCLVFSLLGKSGGKVHKYAKDAMDIAGTSVVTVTGKVNDLDEDIYTSYTSMDGSVLAFTTSDKDNWRKHELFLVGKDLKAKSIAEEVDQVVMSADGKYIVYTTVDLDAENAYADEELYIYDVKKGKAERIDDGVYNGYLAVSPNGKYVAYLKEWESSSDNELYVAGLGKKATKLDKDGKFPVCVSDNGKKVFFRTDEGKLYVHNGKESTKLANDGVNGTVFCNSDGTQVLYNKDGKTYYYKSGKEAVKVCGDGVSSVLVKGEVNTQRIGTYCACYPEKDFNNAVFYAGGAYYWLNKGKESVKIVSDASDIAFSEDLTSVVYVKKDKLYKIAKINAKMVESVLYEEEDVLGVIASKDLKTVYAAVEDNKILYIKSAKKAVEITDENDREKYDSTEYFYDSYACYDDVTKKLYYIVDSEVYSATNSKKSAKKVSAIDDEVSYIGADFGLIVYCTKKESDVYLFDGKKSTLIIENDN